MIGLLSAIAGALAVFALLHLMVWHGQLTDWRLERRRARADHELRMRVEERMWRAGLYEQAGLAGEQTA